MIPIMWKFPTKPWFLRGCLVLGGWDYLQWSSMYCTISTHIQQIHWRYEGTIQLLEYEIIWENQIPWCFFFPGNEVVTCFYWIPSREICRNTPFSPSKWWWFPQVVSHHFLQQMAMVDCCLHQSPIWILPVKIWKKHHMPIHMGVSTNWGSQKGMLYDRKPY